MIICGEKILLRAIEATDNQMLLALINDPDTEMMLGGSSWPISEAEQLKWYDNQEKTRDILRCIIAARDQEKEAVGTVILSDIDEKNGTAQIHIKILRDARGKGYGTDAIKTAVAYAFKELRLNCIYAHILSYNEPSIRLFSKCNFKKEGILRSRIYKGGSFVDVYSFSIIKEDGDYAN